MRLSLVDCLYPFQLFESVLFALLLSLLFLPSMVHLHGNRCVRAFAPRTVSSVKKSAMGIHEATSIPPNPETLLQPEQLQNCVLQVRCVHLVHLRCFDCILRVGIEIEIVFHACL